MGIADDLRALHNDTQREGWDGYGAAPTSAESLTRLLAFIDALPSDIDMPTPSAHPDGDMGVEWCLRPDWIISLCMSTDGKIHYAALLGERRVAQAEQFTDIAPDGIVALIRDWQKSAA